MKIKTTTRAVKVLDFDIENRPLSYWYDGNPTAEVTAIAASWIGDDHVHCWLLTKSDDTLPMLEGFMELYNQADIVTGHYIRKHDLPILNGAMMEHELPTMQPKYTQDTKMDLIKRGGLSMSQEALSAMFGIDAEKVHMTQQMWRDANRLTKEGLELTKQRVVGDIIQHKQLREELLRRGLLKAPRLWRP
jgi:hypothetical protein